MWIANFQSSTFLTLTDDDSIDRAWRQATTPCASRWKSERDFSNQITDKTVKLEITPPSRRKPHAERGAHLDQSRWWLTRRRLFSSSRLLYSVVCAPFNPISTVHMLMLYSLSFFPSFERSLSAVNESIKTSPNESIKLEESRKSLFILFLLRLWWREYWALCI